MTPQVNNRIRWISDNPDHEPIGTVVRSEPDFIVIHWDDGHKPTTVDSSKFYKLEVV